MEQESAQKNTHSGQKHEGKTRKSGDSHKDEHSRRKKSANRSTSQNAAAAATTTTVATTVATTSASESTSVKQAPSQAPKVTSVVVTPKKSEQERDKDKEKEKEKDKDRERERDKDKDKDKDQERDKDKEKEGGEKTHKKTSRKHVQQSSSNPHAVATITIPSGKASPGKTSGETAAAAPVARERHSKNSHKKKESKPVSPQQKAPPSPTEVLPAEEGREKRTKSVSDLPPLPSLKPTSPMSPKMNNSSVVVPSALSSLRSNNIRERTLSAGSDGSGRRDEMSSEIMAGNTPEASRRPQQRPNPQQRYSSGAANRYPTVYRADSSGHIGVSTGPSTPTSAGSPIINPWVVTPELPRSAAGQLAFSAAPKPPSSNWGANMQGSHSGSAGSGSRAERSRTSSNSSNSSANSSRSCGVIERPMVERRRKAKHRRQQPPWLLHRGDSAVDATGFGDGTLVYTRPLSLHEDISLLVKYLELSQDEIDMREDLLSRLRALIHELWPKATIEVYGSYSTGLCLPVSDIDIVVNVDSKHPPGPILAEALRGKFWCYHLDCLPNARVPIIKMLDSITQLAVDISFNSPVGPNNSRIIRELLRRYPYAKPLTLILKLLLYTHALNEVYVGGLGSYAASILVVSYIQHRPQLKNLRPGDHVDLGTLLLGMLQFYGADFDIEHVGISVLGEGTFFEKSSKGWYNSDKPLLLAIEDPANPDLDIGKCSYNIMQIRQQFYQWFSQIKMPPTTYGVISPMSCIVDASRMHSSRVSGIRTFLEARSPLFDPSAFAGSPPTRPARGASTSAVSPFAILASLPSFEPPATRTVPPKSQLQQALTQSSSQPHKSSSPKNEPPTQSSDVHNAPSKTTSKKASKSDRGQETAPSSSGLDGNIVIVDVTHSS